MNLYREAVKVLEKKGLDAFARQVRSKFDFVRISQMEQQTKNLINRAVETLARATGIKLVHREKVPKAGNAYPDGLVRVDYEDMQWDFAIQAKARLTRAIVAMEKTQPTLPGHDRILVTESDSTL